MEILKGMGMGITLMGMGLAFLQSHSYSHHFVSNFQFLSMLNAETTEKIVSNFFIFFIYCPEGNSN